MLLQDQEEYSKVLLGEAFLCCLLHFDKLISAILVFLCLGHIKTKENQTDILHHALISELQNLVYCFEVVIAFYIYLKSTLLDN